MRTMIMITCLCLVGSLANAGIEPPFARTIPERVRMATHVIIGEARAIQVMSEKTDKPVVPPPRDLDDAQRMELEIRVIEVLQADKARPLKAEDHINVRIGGRGLSPEVFKKMLLGRNLIFHLSWDEEHAARFNYFFPFFGWPNLTDPVGKSAEVKSAITKQKNVTN